MNITTKTKTWYKKVEFTVEDGNTKIECSADGEKELLELKNQIELALEDINYVLEDIESKRTKVG